MITGRVDGPGISGASAVLNGRADELGISATCVSDAVVVADEVLHAIVSEGVLLDRGGLGGVTGALGGVFGCGIVVLSLPGGGYGGSFGALIAVGADAFVVIAINVAVVLLGGGAGGCGGTRGTG